MTRRLVMVVLVVVIGGLGVMAYRAHTLQADLVLTGVVTTNDVIVSPQVTGQLRKLLVTEGDQVTEGQVLAVLAPDELKADTAYYAHSAEGLASQVSESAAVLRWQTRQTDDQVRQAEALLASTEAQVVQAQADLDNTIRSLDRSLALSRDGVAPPQQVDDARTAREVAAARLAALKKQVEAQRYAVALARANAEQVTVRRSQLQATQQQREAAAAQQSKADVRLSYTELRAPIAGIVDVRAARAGEVVSAGQPVVTLVDPDDFWVRADVEESYIDQIRLGDTLTVRLPSGVEQPARVVYRGVDAVFATQRDVSRTKRDIKTFEVRLKTDNHDRHLAIGMTAYVLLPVAR